MGLCRYLVYGLVDPVTLYLRYIGKSSSGLDRAHSHGNLKRLNHDDTHKGRWIKTLLSKGLSYKIVVIQDNIDPEVLSQSEIFWIQYFRKMGCPLTNLTNGGDGLLGVKRSEAFKESVRRSNSSRLISEETRHKMSLAKKGRRPSLACIEAGIQSIKGKKQTLELVSKRTASKIQGHTQKSKLLEPKIKEMQSLGLTQKQMAEKLAIGRGALREVLKKLS